MEIVVFICLLIVPIFSVVSLIVSLAVRKRCQNLKKLVVKLANINQPELSAQQQATNEFLIGEV